MNWFVSNMWTGQTVAVLASGHSMNQAVADSVRGRCKTIVINSTWELASWADMLYAADAAWWMANPDAIKFEGIKISSDATAQDKRTPEAAVLRKSGVQLLKSSGVVGYDPTPSMVVDGGNGLYASVHIAIQAGAARVLLLGANLSGPHWHKKHGRPLKNPNEEAFRRWRLRFESLRDAIKGMNVQVLNCTPNSALQCFPFSTVQEALV